MNSKRAKALRKLIKTFTGTEFIGKAPNDGYLRPGGPDTPITLEPRTARHLYQRAKEKDATNRSQRTKSNPARDRSP